MCCYEEQKSMYPSSNFSFRASSQKIRSHLRSTILGLVWVYIVLQLVYKTLRFAFVRKSFRLFHEDILFQASLQKCSSDVHLMKLKAFFYDKWKEKSQSRKINNGRKWLLEVLAFHFLKNARNKHSVEKLFYCTRFITNFFNLFNVIHIFCCWNIFSHTSRDERPCFILHDWNAFRNL